MRYGEQKKAGFTLIEVMLSIAILSLIAGASIPLYQAFQNRNELDATATAFAHNLRRARTLSQAIEGDSSWGVHIQTGTITVFKGNSYVTRDATFDETSTISSSLAISGAQEYVFSKLSGQPQPVGSLVLTSTNNETRTITINEKGMVNY